MIKEWIRQHRTRNHFDPSSSKFIYSKDLVKILKGQVTNKGHSRNSVYFIVCRNDLEILQGEETITVDNLPNVIDTVFDKCEWFGKFTEEGQSQIIVPNQYDLLINPQKNKIWLESTDRARYYGSGNLQLDKDLSTRILRTDIGFKGLRELVNSSCSRFEYSYSLRNWNK
ncbi:MAG: hypothetical protein ACQER9_01815 [Nanobdellota archaeon]